MHDACIVIWPVRRELGGTPFLEVMIFTGLDIFPQDVYELIPVRPVLLVAYAEGMKKLVLNGAYRHAPIGKVELLPAVALHANGGPTSGATVDHIDVVASGGASDLLESDASSGLSLHVGRCSSDQALLF